MSTITASDRHPAWVLFNAEACLNSCDNATVARDTTRNQEILEVSFSPASPPQPSRLLVRSPDLNPSAFTVPPYIVRAVENLLLIRVAIRCRPNYLTPEDCDYFIYRADPKSPSLKLLSRPHPFFHDSDVGLLRRGDHYTIAALATTAKLHVFAFDLFHSEVGEWKSCKVALVGPHVEMTFPVKIPRNCGRLFYHRTGAVIPFGGERCTMGFVDLWRGMLILDLDLPFEGCVQNNVKIRYVPLPLPMEDIRANNGLGEELGRAEFRRGIAFIKGSSTGCYLKAVHLQVNDVMLPCDDGRGEAFYFRMDNWSITTWSNTKMTSSWDDWHEDWTVRASDIKMDNEMFAQLLHSGLLRNKPQEGESVSVAERGLQNLFVSSPTLGIDGADVVYLMAKAEFLDSKVWVLAIDMENSTLLAATEFGSERSRGEHVICHPSSISSYINAQETPSGA